jgi:hypothetical protein
MQKGEYCKMLLGRSPVAAKIIKQLQKKLAKKSVKKVRKISVEEEKVSTFLRKIFYGKFSN